MYENILVATIPYNKRIWLDLWSGQFRFPFPLNIRIVLFCLFTYQVLRLEHLPAPILAIYLNSPSISVFPGSILQSPFLIV